MSEPQRADLDNSTFEAQLRQRKALAEVEKAELELKEMRRGYLARVCRNPQHFPTLIAALAAILGGYILYEGNYFQNRSARVELQEQRAKDSEQDSKERIEKASERLKLAEQQARAKEAQMEAVQRSLDDLKSETLRASAELGTWKSAHTALLVERDLLQFPSLLRDLYAGLENAQRNLRQQLLKVPAGRRDMVLDRLFEIKDSPSRQTIPPSDAERAACLSAVLLAWSGDSKWLSRLNEASSKYLLQKGIQSSGCIGEYYRALPEAYDHVRRKFLSGAEKRRDSVRPGDEVLESIYSSGLLLGSPSVPTNAVLPMLPLNSHFEKLLNEESRVWNEWRTWRLLVEKLFIFERDLYSLSDETIVGIAVAGRYNVFGLSPKGMTWTSGPGPGVGLSNIRLSMGVSSVPESFHEMVGIVLLKGLFGKSRPAAPAAGVEYEVILPGPLNLKPIQRRVGLTTSPKVTFSQRDWEAMASWMNQNRQVVELLARGSTLEILKRLSHDQIRHLANNGWIEDSDLLR